MAAQEILRAFWVGQLPIEPETIAQAMGVRVLPDNSLHHDGYYSFDHETQRGTIYYNATVAPVRRRFTIAHELGHHVHGDIYAPRDTRENFNTRVQDPREINANRFAASLLMPKDQIEVAVHRRGITSISRLARLFHVSEVAMEFRLKNLGML